MPATKRAASKAKAAAVKANPAPAKRQRVADPLARPIAAAAAGLRDADVPASVVTMLNAMLAQALATSREERHAYEATIVDMVGDLLSGAETRMVGDVSAAEAAIGQLEESKGAKQEALSAADAVVEAKKSVEQEKKHALAEDAKEFKNRTAALDEAEAARRAQERRFQEASSKREELASAQCACMKPLVAGTASDAKSLGDMLIGVLKRFDVDSSIVSALPNVLVKPPAERGPFDTMVLAQLEIEISKRVSGFEATLRDAEAAREAAAAAVQAAEHAQAAARARQLASADAFKAAVVARQQAEAARDEAVAELAALGPAARRSAKERASAEKRLSSFRSGPLDAFLSLRDRAAAVPPEQEATAAAEAAEEAAVKGAAAAPAPECAEMQA